MNDLYPIQKNYEGPAGAGLFGGQPVYLRWHPGWNGTVQIAISGNEKVNGQRFDFCRSSLHILADSSLPEEDDPEGIDLPMTPWGNCRNKAEAAIIQTSFGYLIPNRMRTTRHGKPARICAENCAKHHKTMDLI